MNRRAFLRTPLLAAAALSAPSLTRAARSTPIRVIVPYPAGGPIDLTTRMVTETVQAMHGYSFIIQNKAGSGGNLGTELLSRAAPDGKTIGIATTATFAVSPWLYSQLPYDLENGFIPITQAARATNALVMNSHRARRLGIRTVADLIAYAKAHPGNLSYGSSGNGSPGHLTCEMLKQSAGILAIHIPQNGSYANQVALLNGEVDYSVDTLSASIANIRAGRLTVLATTSAAATALMPGVPPLSKTLPGFSITSWWGLVAPKNTPDSTIATLNEIFTDALRLPTVRQHFAEMMIEPAPSTPQEFGAFIQAERAKLGPIVKHSGAWVD